jgi:hypothetical protein
MLVAALIFVSCIIAEGEEHGYSGEVDVPVYTAAEPVIPSQPAEDPEPEFSINDQRIEMIEVRQSPKPAADHFTAGKETEILVTFNEPVNIVFSEGIPICYVSVYKDDELITLLKTPGDPGGHTLSFQPKSLIDAGNWAEGSYNFELYLEEEGEEQPAAVRTAVFEKPDGDEEERDPPELSEEFENTEDAPAIILSEQDEIPEVTLGEEIRFEAEIYDINDGWLTGEDITWIYDGKEYMTGSTLWVWPYELTPGTYTFTCLATNSAGISSEKEFVFNISMDETVLPDDWCQKELEDALSEGLILPLDRLDIPVSRFEYAALLANFYDVFSQTDEPNPIDGKEPINSLTEKEAAQLMCEITLMTIPDFFEAGDDETLVMETLTALGVFNEYGPDAYQASEKLTNRLALVRMNRLYDAIFSNDLRIIASDFELFKCDIAAGAMRTEMVKAGKHGAVVSLYFFDGSSVYAEGHGIEKHIVSGTGFHVGVLYNGRIHCNVFPAGLPEKEWLESFHVNSGKKPRIEYMPI